MHRSTALFAVALFILVAASPTVVAQLPVTTHHNYATMEEDLRALVAAHPGHAKLSVLGKSVAGLDLWRVDIADFADPEWETLPALIVDGGHHGNEYSGVESAYLVAVTFLEEAASDPDFLLGKRVIIVPVVNPDGWVASGRVNANAVNLNRNYPWMWDARGTDPGAGLNYAGPSAGSEPETKLMMALMGSVDLHGYVSYHCCGPDPGGEVVIPWDPAVDAPIQDWGVFARFLSILDDELGVPYRPPSGTGESIAHAYGNVGAFALLPETQGESNDPVSTEPARARLKEQIGVSRLVYEHLLHLGGRLVLGPDGTLVNEGWGPAFNVTVDGVVVAGIVDVGATLPLPADACGAISYTRLLGTNPVRAPVTTLGLDAGGACPSGDGSEAAVLPTPGLPVAGLGVLVAVAALLGRRLRPAS